MMFSPVVRSSFRRRTTSLAGMYMAYQITRPCSTTFMEAPPSSTRETKDDDMGSRRPTLFYPYDVYYNAEVKASLAALRSMKRKELPDDLSRLVIKDGSENPNNDADENVKQKQDETPQPEPPTMIQLNSCGNKHSGTMTLIGYKGGTIESQINQDRCMVASPYFTNDEERKQYYEKLESQATTDPNRTLVEGDEWAVPEEEEEENSHLITSRLIGVFDGHAKLGEKVSQYAVTELPKLLASKLSALKPEDINAEENVDDVVRILKETFIEIDQSAPAEKSGGCTATVVLQRKSKIYVANAGDSRSFLVVYRPSKKTVEVIYISREDKPHLKSERKRVESMGGQVWLPSVGPSRVLYTDPVTGIQSGLAMSRSIGDWEVGKLGVIAEPLVECFDIDDIVEAQIQKDCQIPDEDESMDSACFFSEDDVYIFACAASDGLMDFASPELIGQTLSVSLFHKDGPHLLTALEQLIYVAAHGWEQSKQGRYRDDICISATEIRRPPVRRNEILQ